LVPAAFPAKGHITMEAAMQRPLRITLTEGPMILRGIREEIVGRVVGVYQAKAELPKLETQRGRRR
jgi:hypothetical protein